MRAMAELIDAHCRVPMQHFFSAAELAVEALAARASEDVEARRAVERAVSRGKALANKLAQLAAIAQAAGSTGVTGDERILPGALIEAAAGRARALAAERAMRLFVEGLETELPALYGNAQWLARAVFELMACAVQCADAGSDVLVNVGAGQGEVSVVVRVAGRVGEGPVEASGLLSFYSAQPDEGIYCRSLGIGLSFARWVIERHGGRIDVADDAHGIAEFALQLPVGVAPGAVVDTGQQVERYAEDLARLLAEERMR